MQPYKPKTMEPQALSDRRQMSKSPAPKGAQTMKQMPTKAEMYPYWWMGRDVAWVESLKWWAGVALLVVFGVPVASQVAMCQLWEFVDKKTIGMISLSGKFSEKVGPYFTGMVKNPADGFVVPLTLWLGFILPGWFFYELWYAVNVGFEWKRMVLYNIVRIGPTYMNFMYVYVLCHKEGHNFGNLFSARTNFFLKYFYNHYVGMFHGVAPGTFTYSHVYNHHKYDNDARDVYCTAYRPRDQFGSWLRYLPEWFGYASNVTSTAAFMTEGRTAETKGIVLSTLWYVAFISGIAYIHLPFALCTLVYAFVEGNILLSVVNFVWHAFICPDDPSNVYITSTTIVEGLNFTLEEEYHVVHHQYAGIHWTKHKEKFEQHLDDGYNKTIPSIFYKVSCCVLAVVCPCLRVCRAAQSLAPRRFLTDGCPGACSKTSSRSSE